MELLLASYVLLVLGSFGLGGSFAAPVNTMRAAGLSAASPSAQPVEHVTKCPAASGTDPARGMAHALPISDNWGALDPEAEHALAHFLNAGSGWTLPLSQQAAPPPAPAPDALPLLVEGFSPAADALELTYRPETDGSGAPFAPMIEFLDNDSDSGMLIRFNGRPLADLRGVTDLPPEALHLVALA